MEKEPTHCRDSGRGEDIPQTIAELGQHFNPNRIIAGNSVDVQKLLPLLEGRGLVDKTNHILSLL